MKYGLDLMIRSRARMSIKLSDTFLIQYPCPLHNTRVYTQTYPMVTQRRISPFAYYYLKGNRDG